MAGLRRFLFLWGGALVALGAVYAFFERKWAIPVIVTGALSLMMTIGTRPGDPRYSLAFRQLLLVALGMIAAGVAMRADVWIAAGVLAVIVILVGVLAVFASRE